MRRPRILFRIAAGPRLGFGHLMRARRLATQLGAEGWLSSRGSRLAARATTPLVPVAGGVRLLDRLRPDAVMLDTPVPSDGLRWTAAARRRGIPVISVHDAGIAPVPSDLAIDGSVAARGAINGAGQTLYGPRYAVIDPRTVRRSAHAARASVRILVALGGGARASVAHRLATAIATQHRHAHVVVAGGFVGTPRRLSPSNVEWLGPQDGLAHVFASADVAIVAGGVTLYEAGAAGVPPIPVAVVPAQVPAIRAFARHGAALDPRVTLGGVAVDARSVARVVHAVTTLVEDPRRRNAIADAGSRLVDGRGNQRVAGRVSRLIARDRGAA